VRQFKFLRGHKLMRMVALARESRRDHWKIARGYAPFSSETSLVSPKIPPSLQINRDYPKLDDAVALFPVYAATANAIYKKNNGLEGRDNTDSRKKAVSFSATTPRAYESLIDGKCGQSPRRPLPKSKDWFLSAEGQQLIADTGYVPLNSDSR
jgi:hypothetical protein